MNIQGVSTTRALKLAGKLPKIGHFIVLDKRRELHHNEYYKHLTKNKYVILDYTSNLNLLENFV
jgi:hypothetical protein